MSTQTQITDLPLVPIIGEDRRTNDCTAEGKSTPTEPTEAREERSATRPQNPETRDTCRELEPGVTPGEVRAEFDDLSKRITTKLDVYVASARKAKLDFDALLPELDRMQAMLSQRGRLRDLMDTISLPKWTEWFEEFRNRLGEEFTIRSIQRKLRQYRGIPDTDPGPDELATEKAEPGSRDDKTRELWVDQDIKVRYKAKDRRMEAEAEYVERQKKVGKGGNPRTDRILGRITVWQAVYAEPKGKVDKPALMKAVLAKVIATAEDTDYFDVAALKKKAEELAGKVKA